MSEKEKEKEIEQDLELGELFKEIQYHWTMYDGFSDSLVEAYVIRAYELGRKKGRRIGDIDV